MRDYLKRLAVPIAAYLLITLALPAANGAATHHEFIHHAMWVVLGCALVVAAIALFGTHAEVSLASVRRLKNTRTSSRDPPRGQP
jgi:4-hydroxybenzoate polyprenyltransferase